jgi:hypothetical protein
MQRRSTYDMLEVIERFLSYTGIPKDTFGRLTVNDANLIRKLRRGEQLTDEAETRIMSFMQNYEDAKE